MDEQIRKQYEDSPRLLLDHDFPAMHEIRKLYEESPRLTLDHDLYEPVDDPRDHCEYKEISNDARLFLERIERLKELDKRPIYKAPTSRSVRQSTSSVHRLSLSASNQSGQRTSKKHTGLAVHKIKSQRRGHRKKPKKKESITHNKEGFPFAQCEYEPSEDRVLFRPPSYCIHQTRTGNHVSHCTSCHLKSCLTTGMQEELETIAQGMKSKSTNSRYDKIVTTLQRRHCSLFQQRYLKKLQIPRCFVQRARELADQNIADCETIFYKVKPARVSIEPQVRHGSREDQPDSPSPSEPLSDSEFEWEDINPLVCSPNLPSTSLKPTRVSMETGINYSHAKKQTNTTEAFLSSESSSDSEFEFEG